LTLEEEVRAFAEKYLPSGADYITSTPVPLFNDHTWEEVFSGKVTASEKAQRAVLKRLRDIWGGRDPFGRK
jgi:hypothetical protein